MASTSRKKQLLLLGGVLLLLGSVELYFRLLHQPSEALARYLFASTVNVERWTFLSERAGDLLVDESMKRKPNVVHDVPAELDRPAFDAVRVPFHLETNEDGFRERSFAPKKAGTKRILLLGDSVSFGKGMERAERFSDRVAAGLPEDVEILNLAIPGCTSICMQNVLEEFRGLAPDLILWQLSSNDLDRTLWHMAEASRPVFDNVTLLRVLTASRALLTLAWAVAGDPFPESYDRALPELRKRYGESQRGILALAQELDAPVALLNVPMADGQDYGIVGKEACAQAGPRCLGVLEVDFHDESAFDDEARAMLQGAEGQPDWVTESASLAGLSEDTLAGLIPNRRFFHDVVHPNALGARIIAAELDRFLRRVWPPLQGR